MLNDLQAPQPLPVQWEHQLGDYVVATAVVGDRLFVGTGDGRLHCIDVVSGRVVWQVQAHDSGLLALAVSPDGQRIATSATEACVNIWDGNGALVVRLGLRANSWAEHLVCSPTATLFASATARDVTLYDGNGEVVHRCAPLGSTASALAFRHDGGALAAACYGGVTTTSLKPHTWGEQRQLAWKGALVSLSYSPDGKVLAGGTHDGAVHFWRLSSGDDSEMSGYPTKPRAIAFDDSARWLATAGGDVVTVWSFRGRGPEGTSPVELFGHRGTCTQVAFQAGTERLASGDLRGTVVCWSPLPQARLRQVGLLPGEVTALRWCGALLVGGDATGQLTAWRS